MASLLFREGWIFELTIVEGDDVKDQYGTIDFDADPMGDAVIKAWENRKHDYDYYDVFGTGETPDSMSFVNAEDYHQELVSTGEVNIQPGALDPIPSRLSGEDGDYCIAVWRIIHTRKNVAMYHLYDAVEELDLSTITLEVASGPMDYGTICSRVAQDDVTLSLDVCEDGRLETYCHAIQVWKNTGGKWENEWSWDDS